MTSSPREKDVWIDALNKVLGSRCSVELELEKQKPVSSNLERSDSKRSEVKSLSAIDAGLDTTDFVRSYSVGMPGSQVKVMPPRSAGSSPVPPQELANKV